MRETLTATLGDLVELAHVLDVLRAEVVLFQRAAARLVDACIFGHTVQVLAGQQALRERREGNAARAEFIERVQQLVLDPTVQHVVSGLVNQQRHLVFGEQLRHLAGLGSRV